MLILSPAARATTVVVTPATMNGWVFFQDTFPAIGSDAFAAGPAGVPLGQGSVHMAVNASNQGPALGTLAYAGTRLDQFTTLAYSDIQSAASPGGSVLSISLQFDVDYDLTDANTAYQGRLVFEPYLSGSPVKGAWQTWDALAGKWWATRAPGNTFCPQASPCTVAQVLSHFPNAGVHTASAPGVGALVFKAGSGWTGFDGNVDALTVAAGSSTTYDFEPPAIVWVDDNWIGTTYGSDPDAAGPATTFGVDAFATIQDGLNAVAAGGTVNVAAGIYRENVVISNPVTLAGAGAAVATLQPALSGPTCAGGSLCAGGSNIILVQSDDVTISGLTLDGDNPTLISGVVVAGADLDARNGIITNHNLGTFNNLQVHDVTVQNIYLRGIYASSGGTFNFHDNTLANVQADPASIAMFNFGGAGNMSNNTVSGANDAISSNHSRGVTFLNNVVTSSGSGVHTDNTGDGGGSADLIEGNQISDCMAGGFGIFTFVPYIAPTVHANTITNCDVGLAAAGSSPTITTATFADNIVDGNHRPQSVGAYVTTSEFGFGVSNVDAVFSANFITNAAQGLFVQDKICSINSTTGCQADADCPGYPGETCLLGATATVSGSCNRISGNGVGVLTEALSAPAQVMLSSNVIAGNTTGADASAVPSGAVNLQGNWWGCTAGPPGAGCDPVTAHVDATAPAAVVPACVGCAGVPDGASCNDGNACTQTDTCQSGSCTGSSPVICTALDQCHQVGTCNPSDGVCSNPAKPNGSTCNDGNACTQTDSCLSGACTGSNPVVCTALDQCHQPGTCNPTNGMCSNPPQTDGTGCNDGNACTTADACQAGTCVGGPAPNCNDNNVCTTDSCNPSSGCVHANNSAACASDSNACTADVCSGGACTHPAVPDGGACNSGDICQAGRCTGPNTLVLSSASLRANKRVTLTVGRASFTGTVNDNDTGGTLQSALTAGTMTIDISDAGSFHVTLAVTGCKSRGTPAPTITCLSADRKVHAVFTPLKGPNLYKARVSRRSLGTTDTGAVTPIAPVTVTIHQSLVNRTDTISLCRTRGASLICRDP